MFIHILKNGGKMQCPMVNCSFDTLWPKAGEAWYKLCMKIDHNYTLFLTTRDGHWPALLSLEERVGE